MGIEALDGGNEMVPVTAAIRLDQELWVRIAKNDQTALFKPKGQRSQGPAPGVDYHDDWVAIYVVCADRRALGALEGATVQTFVWLEEPTAKALETT
eukprot:1750830-Rhodomonas_salina.1